MFSNCLAILRREMFGGLRNICRGETGQAGRQSA